MTFFDMSFPEADEPWIPSLLDIEHFKAEETPGFTTIGFDQLDIPSTLTNLNARKSTLNTRFCERFANRRINAETLERWQVRLQNRFDEIADEYERGYALYAAKLSEMSSDVSAGSSTAITSKRQDINTPDAAINADDTYADRMSKGNTTTTTTAKGQLIEDVNRNIHAFKDLDTEFCKEFENLFLNIFWS